MGSHRDGQTELVLENKQVVAIFFGLALLCGVFFALGYVVGHHTLPPVAAESPDSGIAVQAGEKPSAMPSPTYYPRNPAAVGQPPADSTPAATDLGFYDSVEQAQPQGMAPAPEAASTGDGGVPAPPEAEEARPPIEVVPPPQGITVQVSALTRREDAESLVRLLQERSLPVLVTTGENDPLFHVVIGPYRTEAEAQRTKRLLEQDGFRPFVRR